MLIWCLQYTLLYFLLPTLLNVALQFLVEPHQAGLGLLVLTDQEPSQVLGVELVKPPHEIKQTNTVKAALDSMFSVFTLFT